MADAVCYKTFVIRRYQHSNSRHPFSHLRQAPAGGQRVPGGADRGLQVGLELSKALDPFFVAGELAHDILGRFLVVPETGFGDLSLYFLQTVFFGF